MYCNMIIMQCCSQLTTCLKSRMRLMILTTNDIDPTTCRQDFDKLAI
jgi:hypothetical protein